MITRGAARGLFGLLLGTSLAIAQDAAPKLDPPALVPPATAAAAGSRSSSQRARDGSWYDRESPTPGDSRGHGPGSPEARKSLCTAEVETHRRALEAVLHGP